jgi:DNA-3-methyladenine glycosylase II
MAKKPENFAWPIFYRQSGLQLEHLAFWRQMPARFHYHFRRHDPRLHGVIRLIGPYRLKPSRDRFGMLVRSIISQQISIRAAMAIRGRLETLLGPSGMKPGPIAALSIDQLRSVGLSPQKASYLHDLAAKAQDGTVKLNRISRLSDEQIIEELIAVKGIGRWTAQMFLIFALAREDVFPIDDFGVRSAISRIYAYKQPPDRKQLLAIGQRWSPYASIASWYCWRFLDLQKKSPVIF